MPLIELYTRMARNGITTTDNKTITEAFSKQETVKFRNPLKLLFNQHHINSVLDYGAGGAGWNKTVPEGPTMMEYVGISQYFPFEPARDLQEKTRADAVVCFDVLEHVFIADIGWVLTDVFDHADKLVVLNVACYPARALLPSGENAHITVRAPDWWLGAVQTVASAYPHIHCVLFCSNAYGQWDCRLNESTAQTITKSGFVR